MRELGLRTRMMSWETGEGSMADRGSASSTRVGGGAIYWDGKSGEERVLGGHDQESCFGLVNLEVLVRCPRRDAKWPVG